MVESEEEFIPMPAKIRFCFMVRHGERADCVDEDIYIKNLDDPPLTEHGIKQARETGEFLAKYLEE